MSTLPAVSARIGITRRCTGELRHGRRRKRFITGRKFALGATRRQDVHELEFAPVL